MKRIILVIVCVVAVASVFCENVHAADHTHDGFFIRLAPGIGAFSSSEEGGGNKLEITGSGGLFNFAVGGAVADNLILHLDLSSVGSSDPTVKLNGQEVGTADEIESSTSLIGIGLTYYFPSNMYLTGAVGSGLSKIKINGEEASTDRGYGINFMIGKEWWVSENWGLGLAGQLLYTSCPDQFADGTEADFNTTTLGVLFSATYN